MGGRGVLQVGQGSGQEGILASSHGSLPGNLGGRAGDAEAGGETSSVVVLLVDGSGGLRGLLVGVAGQQGADVGLHQLTTAVQLALLGQQSQGRLVGPLGGQGGGGGEAAGHHETTNSNKKLNMESRTLVREQPGLPRWW